MEAETILSIDATNPILRAVLAKGDGAEIEVKEAFTIDASEWWDSHFARRIANNSNPANEDEPLGDETDSHTPQPTNENAAPFPIGKILEKLPANSWEESMIVLPAHQAITLHLELPFSQKSSLSRIAPLEAQDKLPFNVSTFHCHARPLGSIGSNLYDIQVDLYPNNLLSDLISRCKELQFEPTVVTIPPGLGEICHSLYPKYINKNSFLIFRSALNYSVTALVDGNLVGYFSIPLESDSGHQFPGEGSLNVWIAAIEERYSCMIERIYFVGEASKFTVWEKSAIIRQTEQLDYEDLLPNCNDQEIGLPTLAATALAGERQETVTPNYRTGRYLFRPELRNLFEGSRTLITPLLLVLLAFLIIVPVQYLAREYRISSLEKELNIVVNQAFPNTKVPAGRELAAAQSKLQQSRTMLQQLGTGDGIMPHKELVLLLEKLKKYPNLALKKVNILAERAVVEGTAESYSDAEQIETSFKQLGDPYCEVSLSTTRGRSRVGQQSFELNLTKVCDK